jgi:transcriptional antiterminator NusG
MDQANSIEKWFALVVKPRHEKAVSTMLEDKGYETFLPLYRQRHTYSRGRFKVVELPLFPGYVFSRFDPWLRLPILTTPGVFYVVGVGRTPAPLDDQEIESLQIVVKAGHCAQPHPFLEAGQRVRITDGPLTGVEGVLVYEKQSPRLVLSITLLQRSVRAEVDREHVTSLSPPPWMPTLLSTQAPHHPRAT